MNLEDRSKEGKAGGVTKREHREVEDGKLFVCTKVHSRNQSGRYQESGKDDQVLQKFSGR